MTNKILRCTLFDKIRLKINTYTRYFLYVYRNHIIVRILVLKYCQQALSTYFLLTDICSLFLLFYYSISFINIIAPFKSCRSYKKSRRMRTFLRRCTDSLRLSRLIHLLCCPQNPLSDLVQKISKTRRYICIRAHVPPDVHRPLALALATLHIGRAVLFHPLPAAVIDHIRQTLLRPTDAVLPIGVERRALCPRVCLDHSLPITEQPRLNLFHRDTEHMVNRDISACGKFL